MPVSFVFVGNALFRGVFLLCDKVIDWRAKTKISGFYGAVRGIYATIGCMTYNGLPLYEDMITDEGCGMLRISLVDLPAVESDFQKFGKRVRVIMESEEKRLILGVVMRANFPIYRVDARGEYYTRFSAETIRQMAEKYLEENRQNRVNLMHCGEEVRGVNMVQLFIKDSSKGIAPEGFEDIEDGSLFAEFHIADDDIWSWIKEGILKGFSLEGIFNMEETNHEEDMEMKKWKRVLAKIVTKFAELTTDKGILTYEGELEVGKDVYILQEDGEITDAPDGEYKAEDGRTIVVADSKVSEIREAEEAEGEGSISSRGGEGGGGDAGGDFFEDETQIADDVDIHNLAAEVERIKEELEHKKEEIADLKDRVAALEGKSETTEEALRSMSAAKPAHEEVKATTRETYTDKHNAFLAKLAEGARK